MQEAHRDSLSLTIPPFYSKLLAISYSLLRLAFPSCQGGVRGGFHCYVPGNTYQIGVHGVQVHELPFNQEQKDP